LKRKILILLFTALMVFSISVPAFATHGSGLLFGISGVNGTNSNTSWTDGDHATSASSGNVEYNYSLSSTSDIDKVYADFDTLSDSNPIIKFYNSSGTLITSYTVSDADKGIVITIPTVTAVTSVGIVGNYTNSALVNIVDVDIYGVGDTTPPATPTGVTATAGDASVSLDWTSNTETDLAGYNVYQSTDNTTFTKVNTSLITTKPYSITGLTNGTTYYFTVSSVDTSGNESTQSTSVSSTPTVGDTTPPGEVTALSETHTDTTVDLTWTNPTDTDFSHSKVYRDGVLVGNNITTASFSDSGLTAGTDYTYKVTTVDTSGNESTGTSLLVTTTSTTDITAPEPPTNVEVTPLNTALYVKYDFSVSDDVYGYNVYVDGVKYNTSEIQTNYYNVEGLTNGTTYSIQVSAVDTSGNESSLTLGVNGTPSKDAVPLIKLDFDLTDVVSGVSNWFGSIWLIVAFAVGIPLSFVIAGRVKGLFSI
jgi:chitodextrinase